MSLVPLKTNVTATQSLYAPASGGGGGGGGSTGFSTISVSSISFPAVGYINQDANPGQLVIANATTSGVNDISLFTNASANGFVATFQPGGAANIINLRAPGNSIALTAGATDAGGAAIASAININGAPSSLTIIADKTIMMSPLAVSSITCSTINGVAPGAGGAAVSTFPDLTVSNSLALGATLNMSADDTNLYKINCVSSSVVLGGLSVGTSGGRNQVYMDTAEAPNFYTSTIKGSTGQISLNPNGSDQIVLGGVGAPGDITVTTVGGGKFNILAGSVSTVTNDIFVNGSTYANIRLAAAGSGNALNMRADNAASARIWSESPAGVTLSTIGSINGGQVLPYSSTPFGSGQAYLEAGYAQDVPYTSTILFSRPFTTENVCVMLTPTNRNISGGANPNISLAQAYGISGTGVSSIGFSVDTRNGGVGYDGSFMWMAFPRNQ